MKKIVLIVLFSLIFSISYTGNDEHIIKLLNDMRIQPLTMKTSNFTLKDINDKTISLNDHIGKVVFLNFWATWCGPCRIEMPHMDKLNDTMKGKDFVILAVSVKESKERVQSYMKSANHSFSVLLDPDGAAFYPYRTMGIPTTYIISKQGNVIGRAIGVRQWASETSIQMFKALAK